MESFTDLDLYEELQQYHSPTPIRKKGEGITAHEYVDLIHKNEDRLITERQAHKRLKKMIALQGWKVQQMIDFDGVIRNVYLK
jgi:hypothetical protein